MRKLTSLILFLFCLGCLDARADRKDRGVASLTSENPHLAKGEMMLGGSASYSMHNNDTYRVLIIENVNSQGYNVSAKPFFLYAVADDFAIGVSGLYKRGMTDLRSAGVSLMGTELEMKDFYSISNKWGVGVLGRKYLVLGHSGRFALFVDMELNFSCSQSKISNRQNNQIIGTYQTDWWAGVGVNPGVSIYVTEHFALQAGLGILNFGIGKIDQVRNQVGKGSASGFKASYAVDLLALNVGVAFRF